MIGDRFRAGKRLWSAADDAELRRTYPDLPTATIARQLRRTVLSISARAGTFGLRKSAAYLASPAACRTNGRQGLGTRFEAGHVPANKGLRRPGWGPGRMKTTQFKPGHRSGKAAAHYRPIGSTRLVEGYVYRKVSDVPNVPYTVNWKPEHVRIWQQAHGPVPAGSVLVFRNHDRTDVRLDNLECIARRALMARNTVHNLPKPLAQAVQLLGVLTRKIRRSTRDAEHDRHPA